MPGIQNSNIPCLSSQYQDSRDRGVGKERMVPGVDIMLELKALRLTPMLLTALILLYR